MGRRLQCTPQGRLRWDEVTRSLHRGPWTSSMRSRALSRHFLCVRRRLGFTRQTGCASSYISNQWWLITLKGFVISWVCPRLLLNTCACNSTQLWWSTPWTSVVGGSLLVKCWIVGGRGPEGPLLTECSVHCTRSCCECVFAGALCGPRADARLVSLIFNTGAAFLIYYIVNIVSTYIVRPFI